MKKQDYIGDGLAFYKALRNSDKNSEDVRAAMNVSNGTFYRLFRKEVWTDYEKELAGKALDLDWQIMFGLKPTVVTGSKKNSAENDQYQENEKGSVVSSQFTKNQPLMIDPKELLIQTLADTVRSQQQTISELVGKIHTSPTPNLNYKKGEKPEKVTARGK